jgi:hypothetical protein
VEKNTGKKKNTFISQNNIERHIPSIKFYHPSKENIVIIRMPLLKTVPPRAWIPG